MLAVANNYITIPLKADGAITTDLFVMIGSADATCAVATAGAKILGIATDTVVDTRAIAIAVNDVYRLKLGGTVSAGQRIKSDANGAGVLADTNTDEFGAVALQDGVVDDVISVLLEKGTLTV